GPGLPAEAIGYREDRGGRGLVSLGILFVASAAAGIFAMRNSTVRGADYVVLVMFIGIVFAFVVAIANWVCDKLLHVRFLSRLAQQVTFVMVPPLFLISLPGGVVGFLVFVNVFVFLLAFFLDFFEIAFIVIPLLGPAADRLGIDLIWFGVVLGVNMQTSFMHPPFGFALFYLRSVAPRESYIDRVSAKRMPPVTTGEIYWGAVPFVVIQCIAVGMVIALPALVMHYKGTGPRIDPSKIQIEIP